MAALHVTAVLEATENIIMFLINKIKKKIASIYASWLSSTVQLEENPEEVRITERDNITSTDFIDYDGMGNQGRFPSVRKKK